MIKKREEKNDTLGDYYFIRPISFLSLFNTIITKQLSTDCPFLNVGILLILLVQIVPKIDTMNRNKPEQKITYLYDVTDIEV